MLAAAQKNGDAHAVESARARLGAAPGQIAAEGLQHGATEREPAKYRSRRNCLRRPSPVASKGSAEASRKAHSQSGRYLGQVFNTRYVVHWLGRYTHFGVHRGFNTVSIPLFGFPSHSRLLLSNLCKHCVVATPVEHIRRHAALHHEHDGRSKCAVNYGTRSHRSSGNQSRRQHYSQQLHTYALCPRAVRRLLAPHCVNSSRRNLGGNDYFLGNGLCEACSDGLGGGLGRGGAGAFAKVFLLESTGFSRMEKAGDYGNRLSRTSAKRAARS